jgi:hypothetical protein
MCQNLRHGSLTSSQELFVRSRTLQILISLDLFQFLQGHFVQSLIVLKFKLLLAFGGDQILDPLVNLDPDFDPNFHLLNQPRSQESVDRMECEALHPCR